MKTFTETQGNKPFDWSTFIDRCIDGSITLKEYKEGLELCNEWNTCPVGNLSVHIPRDNESKNCPLDDDLLKLGKDISDNLENQNFEFAKEQLIKIETLAKSILDKKIVEAKELLADLEGWNFDE